MDEIHASFNAAVETLPADKGRSIDDRQSMRLAGGVWYLKDSRGLMVAKVQDPNYIDPDDAEKKKREPLMATKAYVDSMATALTSGICKQVVPEIGDIRKCIELLATHVKELEGDSVNKSLDAEAYAEMVSMAERLEQMEARLAESEEHGFKYRGYWRDGTNAKRGEAYTNDGSLWYCLRNTGDKPCRESNDWNVVARKGRDAQ